MSTTSRRRRFAWTLGSIAPLLVAACGGTTTSQPQLTGPGANTPADDAGPTGPSNPGSPDDAGGPTGSTGPTVPNKDEDAGPIVVTPVGDGAVSACPATGSEVVMIGDSYPALSGEIGKHLQLLATEAGALASGDAYRTYYVSGTSMSGGMSPTIPEQFQKAVTANPDVKYVIMDGGGNDILLDDTACITTQPPPASQQCVTTINNAVNAATTLFATMKTDGVEKIVYYFYPHLPTTGKPYVNDTLDYAAPLVEAACSASPVPCFFVDTRPAFTGHPEYIGNDGIHPTTAGSDVIAGLVWAVMQQQCIAQ